MSTTESAALRLARAGFEPLPTQDGCFTVKHLSGDEVRKVATVLRELDGLFLSVEGFDDAEEPVADLVIPAGVGFPDWARLPEGVGYHVTVFAP